MYTHTCIYLHIFCRCPWHVKLKKKKTGYKMVYSRFYFHENKPASSYMCAYACVSAFSEEKGGEGYKGRLRVG